MSISYDELFAVYSFIRGEHMSILIDAKKEEKMSRKTRKSLLHIFKGMWQIFVLNFLLQQAYILLTVLSSSLRSIHVIIESLIEGEDD